MLTGVSSRDMTIVASRCINKQAFYIGNGVMNIISEFPRILCLLLAKTNHACSDSRSDDFGSAYTYRVEIDS
jgi:hypothetical protein